MYEEIAAVVAAHREEIEADLDRARHSLQRAQGELRVHEARVTSLEGLLTLAQSEAEDADPDPSTMTLHDAMVTVLKDAPGNMLRAADLAALINQRHLYRMRDGRPVETQQIHARVNNYPRLLAKKGTFITLA